MEKFIETVSMLNRSGELYMFVVIGFLIGTLSRVLHLLNHPWLSLATATLIVMGIIYPTVFLPIKSIYDLRLAYKEAVNQVEDEGKALSAAREMLEAELRYRKSLEVETDDEIVIEDELPDWLREPSEIDNETSVWLQDAETEHDS